MITPTGTEIPPHHPPPQERPWLHRHWLHLFVAAVLAGGAAATAAIILSPTGQQPASRPADTRPCLAQNGGYGCGTPAFPADTAPPPAQTVLTKHEAARAYVRIVGPGNQVVDALNRDQRDAASYSQYRADLHAWILAMRQQQAGLLAVRWPANVQPYITAMTLTDIPADIGCAQAELKAYSWNELDTIQYSDQACAAADSSTTPDTIRERLGLPGRY